MKHARSLICSIGSSISLVHFESHHGNPQSDDIFLPIKVNHKADWITATPNTIKFTGRHEALSFNTFKSS